MQEPNAPPGTPQLPIEDDVEGSIIRKQSDQIIVPPGTPVIAEIAAKQTDLNGYLNASIHINKNKNGCN